MKPSAPWHGDNHRRPFESKYNSDAVFGV